MSNNHYDLVTTGTGFINRFRLINPSQGNPYYAINIAALRGEINDEGKAAKTYVDCNVVGNAAVAMAKLLEPFFDDNAEPVIMIGFTFGDLEERSFVYQSGDRKGQTGSSLKARLFDIKWYRINQETFYSPAEIERKAKAETLAESNAQPLMDDANESLAKPVLVDENDPYREEMVKQLVSQGYEQIDNTGEWHLPPTSAMPPLAIPA